MEDYADRLSAIETAPTYWLTIPLTEFSESLDRWLRLRSISRADLAKLAGTSRAHITQVLRGDANLSAMAMTKLAMAVGAVVHIHVTGKDVPLRWHEMHDGLLNTVTYGERKGPLRAGRLREATGGAQHAFQ